MATPVSRTVLAVLLFGVGGCPQLPEGNPTGSDGAPDEDEPAAVPSSICDPIADGGLDESAGLVEDEACPQSTADAIRIEWFPDRVIKRRSRSAVFFNTKNLLREPIDVEYEVMANMVGSETQFEVRLPQRRRSFDPRGGGLTEADLQLGVELNVLTEGEVEIAVRARLVSPTETSMVEMSRVVVSIALDDDGYIYEIDHVE